MYGIVIDPSRPEGKYRQLVDQLRDRVLRGELAGGTRLASSRDLAAAVGVARGVVVEAVEQLVMEGFLEARVGAGTWVRDSVSWPVEKDQGTRTRPRSSPRPGLVSYLPGVPDPGLFPRRAWLACYHQAVEYATDADLGYTRPAGRDDLRQALAVHLAQTKGMRVSPGQILVTAGSAQGLSMVLQLHRGTNVVVEDPGAPFVRRLVVEAGATPLEVPVDREGLVTDALPDLPWSVALVTPGHQFPLGGTLPAPRRAALLAAAAERGAWVVEDDFDTDLRYRYRSVPPLQVTAPDRVVHVGSFSKTLTPALRLGYLVAPEGLVGPLKALKTRWDLWNEGFQQKAMARFLAEGHLDRHLRRSLAVYRARSEHLRRAVETRLAGRWSVFGDIGTHLILEAAPDAPSAAEVSARLARQGLQVEPVSAYAVHPGPWDRALVVGFGHRSVEDLDRLVTALAPS